jgi:hypothetical protein
VIGMHHGEDRTGGVGVVDVGQRQVPRVKPGDRLGFVVVRRQPDIFAVAGARTAIGLSDQVALKVVDVMDDTGRPARGRRAAADQLFRLVVVVLASAVPKPSVVVVGKPRLSLVHFVMRPSASVA